MNFLMLSRSGTVICSTTTWENYCKLQKTACRCLSTSKAHHTLPLQKCKNMCFCSRVKTSFAVTAGLNFPGKMLQTRWSYSREPFSDKKTRGQTDSPESESSEPRNCPPFRTVGLFCSSKNTHKFVKKVRLWLCCFCSPVLQKDSPLILIRLVLTDCCDLSGQNLNVILVEK